MSWAYYFKPIVAKGEGIKREAGTPGMGAGATSIPVTNANTYFTAGDPIFLQDATQMIYCGRAQSVSSSAVTLALPTWSTMGNPYYVIKPQHYCIFRCDYKTYEDELDFGIENFHAAGGKVYRTQVKGAQGVYTLTFDNIDSANWIEWHIMLGEGGATRLGLETFTIAFWNYEVQAPICQKIMMLNTGEYVRSRAAQVMSLPLKFMFVEGSGL